MHRSDLFSSPSSLETTRIYTMQTPDEQSAFLDKQEELRRKKR